MRSMWPTWLLKGYALIAAAKVSTPMFRTNITTPTSMIAQAAMAAAVFPIGPSQTAISDK
ncbi:hypothetical protein [Peribacillus sp. SCS-155]|uniref:hypothetical protein n=1 Tax=Peribacillus sedimenti TaxID=3115297 RepID=UPI0039063B7C